MDGHMHHVCMYGMYVCMYVCMYVQYVCMYVCMYVHLHSACMARDQVPDIRRLERVPRQRLLRVAAEVEAVRHVRVCMYECKVCLCVRE